MIGVLIGLLVVALIIGGAMWFMWPKPIPNEVTTWNNSANYSLVFPFSINPTLGQLENGATYLGKQPSYDACRQHVSADPRYTGYTWVSPEAIEERNRNRCYGIIDAGTAARIVAPGYFSGMQVKTSSQ